VVANRTRSLVVVLDRLEDTFNMAAVLRTCEAMGVQEIHVIEDPAVPFHPNVKVTQGCDKWLDVSLYRSFAEVKAALHPRGFRLWASAVREGAADLYSMRFDHKVALVFGNERHGVSADVVEGADGVFWIPMRGFTRSMNISAAASACITRAISWRAEHGVAGGDLSEGDAKALKERFYELSVKQRARIYGR
jgi:tRNA (guanosine-2'-O-)-methyltransferase